MHRFFILFALLAISCYASSTDRVKKEVRTKLSKESVGNSTLLLSSKPDSICVKSICDGGSIQACLESRVFNICSAFCFNNGFNFFCCDGDFCCCY